jgi:formamidopyrimidine-DNA glycosylase
MMVLRVCPQCGEPLDFESFNGRKNKYWCVFCERSEDDF